LKGGHEGELDLVSLTERKKHTRKVNTTTNVDWKALWKPK